MHPRRKARIGVLCALYAEAQVGEDTNKIIHDLFQRDDYEKGSQKFIQQLFNETMEQVQSCDGHIKEHLQNWEFSRIALLDKLILRMAITEMLYSSDVPPKVAISEAIEIAKEFSTPESSSFVNGILDAVYKQSKLEQQKQAKAS